MSALHRIPTARNIRRAIDTLAHLGPDMLAHLAEALVERLDTHTPDPDLEPDDYAACEAEDTAPLGGSMPPPGDDDDAEDGGDDEPDHDAEEDDPHGAGEGDADMPVFPASTSVRRIPMLSRGARTTHLGRWECLL